MKKWLALLVVLLCLLAGSALAEDTVNICGTEYSVTTTPRYFCVVGQLPVETGANENNYNLKLVLEKGIPTITLRNAEIKVPSDKSAVFSTDSSLVIRGEGVNHLEATATNAVSIRTDGNCTFEGQIESIRNNGGKNIYVDGNCTVASGAKIGAINGGSSSELYIVGQLTIDGTVGSIGEGKVEKAIWSKGNVVINGSIGEIQAGEFGIDSDGKVSINNSVGPISVSGSSETKLAVRAKTAADGIVLGKGVSMVEPKNGSIRPMNNGYTAVYNEKDEPSAKAQFVKAPASTVPPAPTVASSVPKTGDDMNLVLWAMLLMLSVTGIAAFSRKAKKSY